MCPTTYNFVKISVIFHTSFLLQPVDTAHLNQELILKEVAASLAQRKRLADKNQKLQGEMTALESCGNTKSCTIQKTGDPMAKTPPKVLKSSSLHTSPVGGEVSGSRGSSWKRNDGLKNRNKSDKNQPENVRTFDAHLKSIITNALMGENVAEKGSRGILGSSTQKKSLPAKSPQIEKKSPGKKDKRTPQPANKEMLSMESVQDSAIRMALMRNSSPDRYRNAGLKRSPGDSDVSRIKTAGGMPSIKVTIPLGEACKRPPSLPVSIPLTGVKENLSMLNRDGGQLTGHRDDSQKSMARSSSPILRDSYSPISRPSSSSSTISSESIKHLEHGSKVPSTSPKGMTVNTSQTDSVAAVQASVQLSLAKQLAGSHASSSVSGKDTNSSTFSALLLQDKRHAGIGQMPMPGMMPPGAVFPFPIPEKELFLKMMQNGPRMPYAMPPAELVARAAYFGLGLPANGLVRGAPGQEKNTNSSKRDRKRKAGSKCSGGGVGVGIKENTGASSKVTMPNLSGCEANAMGGGGTVSRRTGHGSGGVVLESKCKGSKTMRSRPSANASYIEDIVSNASQPLAISAISDVESTKSSPLVEMVDKTGTSVPVVTLYYVL